MTYSRRQRLSPSAAPTLLDFRLDLVDDRGSDAPSSAGRSGRATSPGRCSFSKQGPDHQRAGPPRLGVGAVGGLVSVLVGIVAAFLTGAGELLAVVGSVVAMLAGDCGHLVALVVLAVSLARLAYGISLRSKRTGR